MSSRITRPSLLARLRDRSDDASWREFDARYRELILRYCRGRGLQPSDAEDVRQQVMMSLATALRGFAYDPVRGRFHAYLGRAVQRAIRAQAARRRRSPRLEADLEEAPGDAAEDPLDSRFEREWVSHHYRLAMRALRPVLEPRTLEVFDRLIAGEPPERVGAELGMSAETVQKAKQRVRARLAEQIAAQVREENGEGPIR